MLGTWSGIAPDTHWVLLLIVIEHVCQDILGVLQPLCHLGVVAVESLVQGHRRSVSLFVNIGYISILGIQQDFRVILEVDLHNFVAQTEHDGVLGPHPLLHVN